LATRGAGGPPAIIQVLPTEGEEIKTVGNWLAQLTKSGLLPHECGIFVRSPAQLDRARSAATEAGMPFKVLDECVDTTSGHVSISTMHLAKGLEFRAVAVMACDDEIMRCRNVSRLLVTTPICKMSTRPSDTFCTWPVPVRETTCWSRALSLHPNFLMICGLRKRLLH